MLYNRIALLRTEKGISRQDLAEKSEVNFQTVGFIVRDDYSPSLEPAFKIAEDFAIPDRKILMIDLPKVQFVFLVRLFIVGIIKIKL